jgi:hypothetical protein
VTEFETAAQKLGLRGFASTAPVTYGPSCVGAMSVGIIVWFNEIADEWHEESVKKFQIARLSAVASFRARK